VNVLKACTQSIVAPAVLSLKSSINTSFPYKDIQGSWSIQIKIDDGVTISHSKWEQSFEEESFKFNWRMVICFDKEMNELKEAHLEITQVEFGQNDSDAKRNQLLKIFHPFKKS